MKIKNQIVLAVVAVFAMFLANMRIGSIDISFNEILQALLGIGEKNDNSFIVLSLRLPKAIAALCVGMALSASGLVMQTLFRNPLAGPYVLGISSGSSLAVAFLILGAGLLPESVRWMATAPFSVAIAAFLGSLFVLLIVLSIAARVQDTATILIVGMMLSSFSGAIVSVLSFFTTAENLQRYTFWSMGSVSNLDSVSLLLLISVTFVGLISLFPNILNLDNLLLGDLYGQSLGVNIKRVRLQLILVTALLVGISTAFCGPIAFVGLAVPHLARRFFSARLHGALLPLTILSGGFIMLLADAVCHLPIERWALPVNAVTSLIGAPVVIYLILRRSN